LFSLQNFASLFVIQSVYNPTDLNNFCLQILWGKQIIALYGELENPQIWTAAKNIKDESNGLYKVYVGRFRLMLHNPLFSVPKL